MLLKMNFSKIVIILVFLCFLIRIIFFLAAKPWRPDYTDQKFILSDAPFYDSLARSILESGRFSTMPSGRIDAYRTPLYPLFISLCYSIFGDQPWVVLIFQIFIDMASCLTILVTIRRFLSEWIAVAAGIFYCI